ncbi:divalent metal cation transporter [Aerococcaceae bacterium zg-B36]|nr:divalent metal cation transporter [Aerococcaceae bacterium zg-B36]
MNKRKNTSTLIGAAFIMATSAIGPGFLTQSAKFTSDLQGSFGFVILSTILLAMIVQLNVWRVLCVSGMRGQDIGNRLFSGLGYFVAALVVLGGLVFNIGNVGGAALGFNALLGIPTSIGYFLAGGLAIVLFLLKNAMKAMDNLTKILGGLMIAVIFIVILIVKPPVGMALKETILPSVPASSLFPAILTLLGGTVGGYITFGGAHRLIDAGITKKEHLAQITQSSIMGIGIASIVRIFLFLAILGVVVKGITLDAANPAADAFRQGAGELGYRFFGLVLLSAALTSIIGAAYTSVSFLKTLIQPVAKHEKWVIIGFIAISTVVMALLGSPSTLLVIAGSLNGLILPVTLGICLVASQRSDIMGDDYKHPTWLLIAGIVVVCLTAYIGIQSLGNLAQLF